MTERQENSENRAGRPAALVLICGDTEFCAEAGQELQRRQPGIGIALVSGVEEARQTLRACLPAVILAEEKVLLERNAPRANERISPRAAVDALLEFAPVVIIGNAAHQLELKTPLAEGKADFVARSALCLPVALAMVERRLRQKNSANLRKNGAKALSTKNENGDGGASQPSPMQPRGVPLGHLQPSCLQIVETEGGDEHSKRGEEASDAPADERDFGDVLRHELNNPLTGILGNAELLLVELRRGRLALPAQTKLRLETIAALAVRMRETVRQLSEQWESKSEAAARETTRLSS